MPDSADARPPVAAPAHMVGALSLAQMVSWGTSYYGFAVLLPELEIAFSANRTSVSFALTLSLLAGGFAAFSAARFMQAGRDRRLMCLGSALGGTGFALLSVCQSLWQVYLAWIVIGISSAGTLYSPAFALITRVFPNDYRSRITTLTLLGGLASTVFWPLLSILVSQFGWRGACFAAALFHWLVCLPIHWNFIPRQPGGASTLASTKAGNSLSGLSSAQRRIALLIACYMVFESLIQAGIGAHLLQIMVSRGLTPATAVAIASCFGLIQTLARGIVLKAGTRLAPGTLARWVVLIAPVSLVLLLFARESIYLALGFALLYGMGNGLSTIVRGTAVADLLSPSMVPRLNGPLEFSRAIASASGPFVAAWIYSVKGYDAVLIAMFLLFLVSASAIRLAWRFHDEPKKKAA